MKKTLIRQAASCLDRIKTALLPDAEGVKKFVLEKTKLNTLPFSLKDHEYQQFILEICSNPDIDLVIQKSSQLGISEVVYRIMLSYMARIPGFSCAIVFPTVSMANEVMKTRISRIIDESEELSSLISKDVDSASVKMFTNGSVLYCLGASAGSKSTLINRPIRFLVVDELARCDLTVIEGLESRQRHQKNKASIAFSTPILEGGDISLEMEKCGVIWEQLLSCSECGGEFFPDFFTHVKLPGFVENIKHLTLKDLDDEALNVDDSYLECPLCKKSTTYYHHQMKWVNTCDKPARRKIGIKLGAFAIPEYVTIPMLVSKYARQTDKQEFINQDLGIPAVKSDTAMDVSQIQFVDEEAGTLNVWGMDVGNVCSLGIGSVTNGELLIHKIKFIPVKDVKTEVPRIVSEYRCVAGVVDFGPLTPLSVELANSLPNSWTAIYSVPAAPQPELMKIKVVDDEALGVVKQININKNFYFDYYADQLMSGKIKFRNSEYNSMVKDHHTAMRRVRDVKSIETRYIWTKPHGSKTEDHIHHLSIYCSVAARLIERGSVSALPLASMVRGFRLKSDL